VSGVCISPLSRIWKRAKLCQCLQSSVIFDIDTFVRREQPDKFQLSRKGKDIAC